MENVQQLSRHTGIHNFLATFEMDKPVISYGNCLNTPPLQMVVLLLCPAVYSVYIKLLSILLSFCAQNSCLRLGFPGV